eukprot:gb/GEZN01010819.1/.p1 GENE.gb/GEZN01010819.1/~~gb/GEZN01010819.1/.p1  ORF type:complete len:377 (+),score=34.50 gb/GEZN01010819.1/:60-1133(+)
MQGRPLLNASRAMVPRIMSAAAFMPSYRRQMGHGPAGTVSVKMGNDFTLGISASGVAKGNFRLTSRFAELAQHGLDTNRQCGEDAFLVQTKGPNSDQDGQEGERQASMVVAGIADGVGGWAQMGVDPGLISHRLLALVADSIRSDRATTLNEGGKRYPLKWVVEAYDAIQTEGANSPPQDPMVGSTTLAIGVMSVESGELRLKTLNVGDSGVVVIRDGRVCWQSKVTQHGTGRYVAPYQLAVIPDRFREADLCQDHPSSGASEEFTLKVGDTVVFASDGLLDNLSKLDAFGAPTTNFSPIAEEVTIQLDTAAAQKQELQATDEARRIVEGLIYRTLTRPMPKIDDVSVICVRVRSSL